MDWLERLNKEIVKDTSVPNGCWLWKGRKDWKGYGIVWLAQDERRVHVVMYELLVKSVPGGLQLDHLCRVKNCVNPAHLEPVTPAVNTQRGNSAKLTSDKVREIRKKYNEGTSNLELSKQYSVSHVTISDIIRNKTWRNI